MRIDFTDLRQLVAGLVSSSIASLPAIGAAAVAVLIVLYALWPADEITADAVVVSGPAFKPVSQTAPARTASSGPYDGGGSTPYDAAASLTRDVQQKLKRAGCYDGAVNGVWNNPTRKAMYKFTSLLNARLPVDQPDPVFLVLLETNPDTVCASGPSDRKKEVASIETGSAADAREASGPAGDVAEEPSGAADLDAEDLGFSSEAHRAPNPIASVQAASTESSDTGIEEAAALSAAGAAAHKVTKPQPRRTARKYRKKNSLSRQVSKGLKSIQRSFSKLF